jgi:uncharacterized SAM-binding protein YcdF (DUF218 family)
MFFIFSKLLIYFISPFIWIMFFFVAALIAKEEKRKKRFFKTSFILFIIFSNPFLMDQFAKRWDYPVQQLPAGSTYNCAILMGGFSAEDKDENGYFTGSSDRFIQAVILKQSGKVSHILMTGGNPSLRSTKYREADFTLTQLRAIGIPDSCILIENTARNSYENAKFSRWILDSLHLSPPYVLVTSAFHMRRASYIFKKMGVEVIPYPCNYIAGREKVTLTSFIPNPSTISTWDMYIKEMVGLIVYHFKK